MADQQRLNDPSGIGAGNRALRLPEGAEDKARRAEIAASATRYLLRTGNGDLLEILGLDRQQPRACEGCGELFVPRSRRQRYCRRPCSLSKAGAS